MKKILAAIFAAVFVLLQSLPTHSFEVGTHRVLSEKAVLSSNLDNFLKTELGFSGGVQDELLGEKIINRIQEGSVLEDIPGDGQLRFFNHFHNPLRTWDEAGLKGILFNEKSSILWGQEESAIQRFAWQDARKAYFEGLTAQNQTEREEKVALTFRTLGHLIHLVQDAGPSHTRNDPHIFEPLESFVETLRLSALPADQALFDQLISSSTGFDPSILTIPPNPLASIPIARIIDTTDPEQVEAVPSAGIDQGIAEYSNSNFLSDDTIFKNFTFPRVESLGVPFDETEPVTGKLRSYFPKIADGEIVDHFVAEGTFTETLISILAGDQGFILDRRVLQDYAVKLLPRTIGYSAGLIDYFFRGRMSVAVSENQPSPINNEITEVLVNVANATPASAWPANAETGNGDIVAVALLDGEVLGVSPQTDPLAVNLTRTPQEVVFNFSHSPLPAADPDLFIQVVYRGPLGLEEDAVVVGGTSLARLIATDDFNRESPGFLETLGDDWVEREGASVNQIGIFGLNPESITPNALRLLDISERGAYAVWKENPFTDDQFSQLTFLRQASLILTPNFGHTGVAVRASGSVASAKMYVAIYSNSAVDKTVIRLMKFVNESLNRVFTRSGSDPEILHTGPGTILAETGEITLVRGNVLRIEVIGSQITVLLNEAEIFNAEDSDIATGRPGVVQIGTKPSFNISGGTWDDWAGGDFTNGP